MRKFSSASGHNTFISCNKQDRKNARLHFALEEEKEG
jgi:hypothetical protein